VLRTTTATLEDSSSYVRSWGSARPFDSYLIYNIHLGWSQPINAFQGKDHEKVIEHRFAIRLMGADFRRLNKRCRERLML